MSDLKIRPLKRKDRRTLADIIKKLADKIGDQSILNAIRSDVVQTVSGEGSNGSPKDDQMIVLGVKIIKMAIETIEDDVAVWFADLMGVTVEQFDDQPFNVELEIIDQLLSRPELSDFFTGASRVYSKIKTFAKRS